MQGPALFQQIDIRVLDGGAGRHAQHPGKRGGATGVQPLAFGARGVIVVQVGQRGILQMDQQDTGLCETHRRQVKKEWGFETAGAQSLASARGSV